uniref:Uncharacterized protein n=2 Tax=Staphylococcus aureus TaxID=1280 RepID=E2FZR0_STAAU|nr:hypothetical protein [Staphylococcus aureus]
MCVQLTYANTIHILASALPLNLGMFTVYHNQLSIHFTLEYITSSFTIAIPFFSVSIINRLHIPFLLLNTIKHYQYHSKKSISLRRPLELIEAK